MKLFVAGATGIIGRRAVPLLIEAGHEVTGVARSAEKAAWLERVGARSARVDLFDPAALTRAVKAHEGVYNLATHIPPLSKMMLPGAWKENDRIRRKASRNLVDAALAAGAERYLQESITFLYEDRGDQWIDEDVPFETPSSLSSVVEAESQARRFAEQGGTGVVLRFGAFHAPDSDQTRAIVQMARRRLAMTIGRGDGYISTVHVDDAARAVAAAMSASSGTYNVVDDEPLTRRAYWDALGQALGVGRVRMLPPDIAKVGGGTAAALGRSHRVSNRRLRQATGWAPGFPSMREAWKDIVAELDRGLRAAG
jgi:nucleoside-diphosphate-sugar epimerase